MNNPESDVNFVPMQALVPTPQLYDELVGDSMEQLAKASLAQIPSLIAGTVIHDNGCGTGAGSGAIVESVDDKAEITIKATDINEKAIGMYQARAAENGWPATVSKMDALKLTFADHTFSHSIGNALLFVLPNDGIDAIKEMHRTLKPGGTLLVNSWAYVPNMEPLQIASKATRPPETPLPRMGMQKWSNPEFLRDTVEKGGFEKENIILRKASMYCTVPELTHFATMLWSFVGGTSEVGWLKSDEEHWDKAIEVIKEELKRTDGFQPLNDGKAKLKFVANIAIATR